jgi:hypothetical protein
MKIENKNLLVINKWNFIWLIIKYSFILRKYTLKNSIKIFYGFIKDYEFGIHDISSGENLYLLIGYHKRSARLITTSSYIPYLLKNPHDETMICVDEK